jgi:putative spermidine/putrescine transport system permease protein
LPAAALVASVLAYPLATLVGESFGGRTPLEHYQRLLTMPVYVQVLQRTLVVSAATTLVCALVGYPVAYALASASGRKRAFLMVVILLPFWTNLLVRTYGWMILLNPRGVINTALIELGLVDQPIALVYNPTGVVIGMVQIMLPYMVLPIAAVMSRMDPQFVHASRSLGAPPLATFLRVYLPLTLPGVMAGVLLVFTISLGFFVIPALLGGARGLVLAQLIEFNINSVLNWGFAAAIATLLLIVTLAIYAIGLRWFGLGAIWGTAR